MAHKRQISAYGFSLIELAIVMTVLGLLIGGVMGAQTMLTNQRLRSIGTDATGYMIAMNQFKQKYNYLPGDMPTATEIWGRADSGTPVTSNCATPTSTASVGKTTCNGNGDGSLDLDEGFRAWQHMQAADMIVGTYTGISTGCFYSSTFVNPPGWNVSFYQCYTTAGENGPNTVIPNATFSISNYGNYTSANNLFYIADYTNIISFTANGNVGAGPARGVITGADAYVIDTKFDDGFPSTGQIVSRPVAACSSSVTGYNRSSTATNCGLSFLNGFGNTKIAKQ
jgi:prepilin-type N-terminal cleavage/methylation domain-containing protein